MWLAPTSLIEKITSVRTIAALMLLLSASGCGGRVFDGSGAGSGGVGAGAAGHAGTTGGTGGSSGQAAGLPAEGRTLDSLSLSEMRALCLEDARRTDPCLALGLSEWDRADCEVKVTACSAAPPLDETDAKCDEVRVIRDCPVTVAQFFECVDAWNPTQTCENAGVFIQTPASCLPVAECDEFKFEFEQFGRPPPCALDEITERLADTNDDIYGLDGCSAVPDRFIVLGNSVATCDGRDPDGWGCAPSMLAHHLRTSYSPQLEYQNLAVPGNLGSFQNLLAQAERADPTVGRVVVWIYSLPEDPRSTDLDLWRAQLDAVMRHFLEPAVASEGAIFMLNTQYSPSDQCPNPPTPYDSGSLTLEEEATLQELNRNLFIDLALERADTVTVDQYPDWLGHGWNAGVASCPHCYEDNVLWQGDPIHPNQLGQVHIFEKWQIAVDRIYGAGCP